MRHHRSRLGTPALRLCSVVAAAVAGAAALVAQGAPGTIERVSVTASGGQTNDHSAWPEVSRDGRFIAFASLASNIVASDTNRRHDVFVRDRVAGTVERVSVTSTGAQMTRDSVLSSVSADGRFVAFLTEFAAAGDMFVRDRVARTTRRVDVSTDGVPGNAGASGRPAMSADGRFVAFRSAATNLVPADTNGIFDVFVRDLVANRTERVSVNSSGEQGVGPVGLMHFGDADVSISETGRFVVFRSTATNLVPGDTNGMDDLFVRDRLTGTTERVSVQADGSEFIPPDPCCRSGSDGTTSVSRDGRFVAFSSSLPLVPGGPANFWNLFVRDRVEGTTIQISQWHGASLEPSMSADGRYVAFESDLAAPGSGSWLVYRHDRATGETLRMSGTDAGEVADQSARFTSISGDGRVLAFASSATNLVADTNDSFDVFVRDIGAAPPLSDLTLAKTAAPGRVRVGERIAYTITATNRGAGDAASVAIADRLPAHTEAIACSSPSGGTCEGTGRDRTIRFAGVEAGASVTALLSARLACSAADGAAITNRATVSVAGEEANTSNNAAEATVRAVNDAPTIGAVSADKTVLWPPNNKMVTVNVSYAARDTCGPSRCALTVTASEPSASGASWEVLDGHRVRLRASRRGSGPGLIYTISVRCTDVAGAATTKQVQVMVPRSASVRVR